MPQITPIPSEQLVCMPLGPLVRTLKVIAYMSVPMRDDSPCHHFATLILRRMLRSSRRAACTCRPTCATKGKMESEGGKERWVGHNKCAEMRRKAVRSLAVVFT